MKICVSGMKIRPPIGLPSDISASALPLRTNHFVDRHRRDQGARPAHADDAHQREEDDDLPASVDEGEGGDRQAGDERGDREQDACAVAIQERADLRER